MPQIEADEAQAFCTRVFEAYGFEARDAARIADSLVDADRHGISSHGIQRMRMYDERIRAGKIVVGEQGETVFETPVSALYDGRHGMGQIVASNAMDIAVAKAEANGIGIVNVRHSNHFGAAGYYSRLAMDRGMWGVAATNSNPLMAPTHSARAFLGSNPLSVGIRTEHDEFLLDGATTAASLGKIEVLARAGRPIEGTLALRPDGTAIVDAREAVHDWRADHGSVSLTPIGGAGETNAGYKGYGLGLLVEILTSAIAGAPPSADLHSDDISHILIAVDPAIFGDVAPINERIDDMQRRIRALPSYDGQPVRVPGDKERDALRETDANGITVSESTLDELRGIAERLNLDRPWNSGPRNARNGA
ncbi:Ldh family oxidoreductase [Bifidobacterium amazonense]|uniref:Ldh family oxidoreductase n=1 Tax=Bifidobacterium amazonense TaxID=2809027 RepID=A0ABS9VS51_9BIFI|nr:Ldh family oxidoreductase [Bifidobacterium amazonense]MCH9274903.1 Ldh family oxidoreductase [Bifidobacterium amazonense]